MQAQDKDRPSAEWIASMRRQFQVEREIDRILTRKLERRAGPGFAPLALSTLVSGLESMLRSRLDRPFRIDEARWLSGGASKLQMAFTLEWQRPGVGFERTPMVLRMEPAESIVETSRLPSVHASPPRSGRADAAVARRDSTAQYLRRGAFFGGP